MSAGTPTLQLRLQGVPQLLADGAVVALGSRKALALLALLALDGAAPRERLAALLWPEVDAAAARRNLRRELFRLRERGVPLDDAPGGALGLSQTLQHEAHGEGRPLDGLDGSAGTAFDDWLQTARERLARQWRLQRLALAQAAEAAGELDAALSHFEALHADDPLREITVRDLMRVHARRGNRAAALQVFEQFARRAQAELDVTPLPETQALAAGLRGAATPATARPAPPAAAEALPRQAPFVGRGAAARVLREAWHSGRLMIVSGEAGEGKSRLVAEVAGAQGAFAQVACRPADRPQPYAAAARVLRGLLAAAGDDALDAELRRELAAVLPEFGSAPGLATAADQQRFFSACARAVRTLAADNFVALVVDDAHNADPASFGLLLSIAQQSGDVLRWVFALRGSETPPGLLVQLDALAFAGAAVRVALGPLDVAAVEELVRTLSGGAAPRFAARLHQATGGNAFFLYETLRHLFEIGLVQVDEAGLWETPFDASTDDYHELPLPPTVRDAVRARVARLGEDAMRLLEAASLLGGPFVMPWLAGCTSLDEAGTVAALEAAEQAHLLATGDGGRDYRFAHDLVPQSLAAALSPARAALLHRKLALALEQAQAAPGLLATHIARHWEAAHEPRRAVAHRLKAGQRAAGLFAHAEALAEFDRALAQGPDGREEVALRHARIEALRHLGDIHERAAEAERLMALGRRLGDRDVEADAAIQRALAMGDANYRLEALRVAEHAVSLAPAHEVTLLRALRIAGWAAVSVGEHERAREHLRRALPLAERLDAGAACTVMSTLVRLCCDLGDFDEALRLYEAVRLHPGLKSRAMSECQVLTECSRLMEATGRRDLALQMQRDGMALAERAGALPSLVVARFNHMRTLFNGGLDEEAKSIARLHLQLYGQESGHPQRHYIALSSEMQLAEAEQRWDDAVAAGRRAIALCDALDDTPNRRMERMTLGRTLLSAGRPAEALQLAREAMHIDDDGRRVLRSAKLVELEARWALGETGAPELLAELGALMTSPALPEEEHQAALDHARLLHGRLLLACGRAGEVAAAVAGVAFTPALVQAARQLRDSAEAVR
ncbi:MAG: AAA family ATPase [Rubrivivax sp.]|nr:AAA family ATPase [Rubrivivax sp.]